MQIDLVKIRPINYNGLRAFNSRRVCSHKSNALFWANDSVKSLEGSKDMGLYPNKSKE
jgi:hypothetical protein